MKFRILSAAVCISIFSSAAWATIQDKRVALVIGNSAYSNVDELANPRNDATEMSRTLRDLGFLTVEGFDLDEAQFQERVREFAKLSVDADLTLLFYAGHGMSVNGTNYLIATDARMEDPTALDWEAISVDFIAKQMQRSDGVSIMFLDACRNNPLARTLSRSMGTLARSTEISAGLARMDIQNPGRGMAVAFATAPGQVALDGEGTHSPFTQALLRHIKAPNTDFTEIMSRVTGDVYNQTNQTQRPWLNSSFTGPVVLNAVEAPQNQTDEQLASLDQPVAQAPGTSNGGDVAAQQVLFQFARDSNQIADYQAYIETFPNGIFVAMARNSIAALERKNTASQGADTQQNAVIPLPAPASPSQQIAGTVPGSNGQHVQGTVMTPGTVGVPTASGQNGTAINPDLLSQPATQYTEQAMALDWGTRREIQARLNLAGFDVGAPDGSFGPRTRAGLQSWQISLGLPATGYINQVQYLHLAATTQQGYTIWAANNPVRQAKPRAQRSNNGNNQIGAYIGGVITGLAINR